MVEEEEEEWNGMEELLWTQGREREREWLR